MYRIYSFSKKQKFEFFPIKKQLQQNKSKYRSKA
jgi:hypothetical protein